jgi:asparagine synthase (glutamine-hydrolysing)
MCGIAGAWLPSPTHTRDDLLSTGRRMTDTIRHRGPDAEGHWAAAETAVVLGHRRLSIIDLSDTGAQPMHSAGGRYVLVFNGEIYNFQRLRNALVALGATFRGSSDTEVLLAGFEAWGIEQTIRQTAGMFALAVWDNASAQLTLARDRLGEKPLYVGWGSEGIVFGSELKALRAGPARHWRIDQQALAGFLRHGYVPGPLSIWEGVFKVRPGEMLVFTGATRQPLALRYWDAGEMLPNAARRPFTGSEAEGVDALDALLRRVVRDEMISDVPLGAFLSGGVDSSLITAIMQQESARPVRTFTIGFGDERYNEAPFARAIADHLGTEHTEVILAPEDALPFVERLPQIYCEPFADSSQLPTLLVSHVTRRHVTVALSGDGGDELFSGYTQYRPGRDTLGRAAASIPALVRPMLHAGLKAIPAGVRRGALGMLKASGTGEPLERLDARMLSTFAARSEQERYANALAIWPDPDAVLRDSGTPLPTIEARWLDHGSFSEQRMLHDTLTYLPDDICVKVDRAAMDASLEVRAPLLHHEVAEFAWSLPLHHKRVGDDGKRILKALLARYVPRSLTERPKRGFAVPLAEWLRGPLRPWAEALVSADRPSPISRVRVRAMLTEHVQGRADHARQLWPVLTLLQWLEVNG